MSATDHEHTASIKSNAHLEICECGAKRRIYRKGVPSFGHWFTDQCSNAGRHCEHTAVEHEAMGWTCDLWPINGTCCPDADTARARYEAAKLNPAATSRDWEFIASALYAAARVVDGDERKALVSLASDARACAATAPPPELTDDQIKKLIVPLAPVSDKWGTKRIVELGKKALGKKLGDADPAARTRLTAIIRLRDSISVEHKQIIHTEFGVKDRLGYLIGYMVNHGNGACELGYASGWILMKLECLDQYLAQGEEQLENAIAAYDLEIFTTMRELAAERRPVK